MISIATGTSRLLAGPARNCAAGERNHAHAR
jgi:hypothetical protein